MKDAFMPLFISSDKVDRLAMEAMALSQAKSKRDAVERALTLFIEHEKGKIPFHETVTAIQADFRQMAGKPSPQMAWTEEDKKQFFDQLSGDE